MIWYVVSDFVRDIGRKIIARWHAMYEKIVTDAYKDVDKRLLGEDN